MRTHRICFGDCYCYGYGVEPNNEESAKWYEKAANQGNTKAQYSLGRCYRNGTGKRKDLAEAVKWYEKKQQKGATRTLRTVLAIAMKWEKV